MTRRHFETLGSTNDAAREWAREGASHGAFVTAARQTAGRGRRGRDWVSPPGLGLYLSLVLRPAGGLETVPRLTMLLSLAAAQAVDELCGLRAQVKWPNDVLLNGRKIAGVLCEAETGAGGALAFCVAGLGLNLNFAADELPPRPVFPASSLRMETGKTFDFEAPLAAVLRRFSELEARFQDGGWETLRGEWERRCFGLGGPVVVQDGGEAWRGTALLTDSDGALIVGTPQGLRRVVAGDVLFDPA